MLISPQIIDMSIKVSGVTKVYGDQKALDNVSFEVSRGEVLGFLGPNGAGKSTMMKIITCFIPPTEGTVTVDGFDIESDSMKVRQLVGYLPESNPLYYDMFVKEYLQFVCGLYGSTTNTDKRIAEMIEMTGLEREQHKQIGQLSKGYKQRVGIAQALIHDPKVLILDEPTSGLDPNQLVGVRSLIKELGKDRTVMFSSHIMQEVEAVSDRVIIIDKGRIVADRKVKDAARSVTQTIHLELDVSVDANELVKLSGIETVEYENGIYKLQGQAENDLRKVLATWAKDNDFLILSMKLEDETLEEIFRKHTQ